MRKNKAGYICLMILLALMLIFFGKTFLLWILLCLAVFGVITRILIHIDAGKIKIDMKLQGGSQEGQDYKLGVKIEEVEKLKVCGYILLELESENQMFQKKEQKKYLIPLSDRQSIYDILMHAEYCGEMKFTCTGIWAIDYFQLFHVPVKGSKETRMLIYPRNVDLQVELSQEAIGAPKEDVSTQSREGNDPSEMYDVREYIPGDDIRAVHWKLSSKMDELLLRQSSDPTHYHVVLLPDFGREDQNSEQTSKEYMEQINGAIAITAQTGRSLLKEGECFCMAVPTEDGLQLLEVQNERQLKKAVTTWLSTPIPSSLGIGLRYFSMQHLEQYFSRLVIISAGEYRHNPNGLEKRIGITIVSCIKGSQMKRDRAQKIKEITEITADLDNEKIYRIIC